MIILLSMCHQSGSRSGIVNMYVEIIHLRVEGSDRFTAAPSRKLLLETVLPVEGGR